MFTVCAKCGAYRTDKIIDPSGPFVVCPVCDARQRFQYGPLFVLTGPSGAGKSTICLELSGKLEEVVILDADILLGTVKEGADAWHEYRNQWLCLCKNISQSGRPVLLCDTAMGVPENVETCVERRYFTTIHRLALVCDDKVLMKRLRSRPAWRNSSQDAFIQEHIRFNRWCKEEGPLIDPPMMLLDTTHMGTEKTARQVAAWVRSIQI